MGDRRVCLALRGKTSFLYQDPIVPAGIRLQLELLTRTYHTGEMFPTARGLSAEGAAGSRYTSIALVPGGGLGLQQGLPCTPDGSRPGRTLLYSCIIS